MFIKACHFFVDNDVNEKKNINIDQLFFYVINIY